MSQKKVWGRIAESWSNFRQRPQKEAEWLVKLWSPGKILDVGCGNCRNLLPFSKFKCYGVDFSEDMLKQAKLYVTKHNLKVNLKVANAANLPFDNNFFDYVVSFAVLHHLKNPELAIKEIYRVLEKNGEAYITSWNKLQLKFLFKRKETHIKWGKENRYHNFISFLEMRRMLKRTGFVILKSRMFGKNIEFLVKK
ncbi:MAG: hypothetical protein CMH62_02445 [Nanoarchaeota archaeon]|nr:hypothetical protein [Nanoarchaeota archaeon]|tara:strand:- start:2339 stop:2923 length:585 start_codon:yes stop_codon:yes gene_type:complete